jgi:tmRNA-binding protein
VVPKVKSIKQGNANISDAFCFVKEEGDKDGIIQLKE